MRASKVSLTWHHYKLSVSVLGWSPPGPSLRIFDGVSCIKEWATVSLAAPPQLLALQWPTFHGLPLLSFQLWYLSDTRLISQ